MPVLLILAMAACGGSAKAATNHPKPTPARPVLSAADNPSLGRILVDSRGFTLYYFVSEEGANVVCTGDCATTWHPLMTPGSADPTSAIPLPGVLGTVTRPDGGRQVTYAGWPLYTYAMDTMPGQALGEDSGGLWFAALAIPAESTPTPTPPPPPPTPVPAPPVRVPPPPTPVPPPPVRVPPPPAPAPPPPPPTMQPVPFGNDGDADNRGGANDGDGNK